MGKHNEEKRMGYTTYEVRIHQDGMKEWFVGGNLHRIDGPAIEDKDGSKQWFVDNKRHRINGPAIEASDGYKAWWLNGKLHRIDGPAIERADDSKEWWVDGEYTSQVDFEAKVKTLAADPCDGKVVEIDGKKYRLSSIA